MRQDLDDINILLHELKTSLHVIDSKLESIDKGITGLMWIIGLLIAVIFWKLW